MLELFQRSLQGSPVGPWTREFFRWKHIDNPFGRSFMLVAATGDRLIGARTFMRWRFTCRDREVSAVRAVDTATDPEWQGQGVFRELTLTALEELRDQIDFVFNTPNEKSLPGYLKMGWQVVGDLPVRILPRRPVRAAVRALQRDPEVAPSEASGPPSPQLLDRFEEFGRSASGWTTVRDRPYLEWRYRKVPGLDYGGEMHDGRDSAAAIYRIRQRRSWRETTICELISGSRDVKETRALLRTIGKGTDCDHMTVLPRAGVELGTRSPSLRKGVTFVVNPMRGDIEPDPRSLGSWDLDLGDVELF